VEQRSFETFAQEVKDGLQVAQPAQLGPDALGGTIAYLHHLA
jgi:hypothetical protein